MIDEILEVIESGQTFLVASHESPDGDALASTLALTNLLEELGKQVTAFNCDGVPGDLHFLPGQEKIVTQIDDDRFFDVGFVLDAGELWRAGNWIKGRCKVLVNIDHHPKSEDFGDIYYVDDRASATGALIYRILKAANWSISMDVATNLYTAILADTGSFRYSNADQEAFLIAGEMVAMGVDPWAISSGMYENQEEVRLRLLALALPTLRVSPSGLFASLAVTLEMYSRSGATSEHTDRFVNYPRSIRGVEVAIFFRQVDDVQYKVGFRSSGNIDVGSLARELGGGGHHNAAGAQVAGELDEVQQQVFAMVDNLLS
ncbi:MAG: bifunctional oligoribonuclease/PAP phosphatase NrnA [Desulfuromonadales bacterium]|nr:bifunctional oligoribonuclease/PAP phosphatase NrnA [Desulfuromonadales bacterium]